MPKAIIEQLTAIPGASVELKLEIDADVPEGIALSTSGMAGLVLPPNAGELVIAPDGDAPGRTAANKLANRATSMGWQVRVMDCPDKQDWNDMANEVAA